MSSPTRKIGSDLIYQCVKLEGTIKCKEVEKCQKQIDEQAEVSLMWASSLVLERRAEGGERRGAMLVSQRNLHKACGS